MCVHKLYKLEEECVCVSYINYGKSVRVYKLY